MHFGLFDLMTSLASAIAILVGVYIVQFFGFVNLFLIMGILSFVNFLILLMIKDL
jgi:hypothetical protein